MRARRRGRGPLGDLGPDARADGGTRTHASVREVRRSPELRPQEPHGVPYLVTAGGTSAERPIFCEALWLLDRSYADFREFHTSEHFGEYVSDRKSVV